MSRLFALLAIALVSVLASTPRDAVVRIETHGVRPNYLRPWEKSAQQRSSGTGFLVDGGRILTNFHVIDNAVDIRVSKTGHSKRWRARVSASGPDTDLATLEIIEDADEFLAGLEPAIWSESLPALQSRVTVRGYPMGGKAQSVTEGVVSRIDCKNYRLGPTASASPGNLLVIQVDSAINGGNSGGPAFDKDSNVIGVAFQGIGGAQSIGYIIPASLARTFLNATAEAPPSPVAEALPSSVAEAPPAPPSTGLHKFSLVDVPFRTQPLENRALRRYFKVPDGTTGVVVVGISPLSALASTNSSSDTGGGAGTGGAGSGGEGRLQTNDVITRIDGVAVGDDGTVELRAGERVGADYLITSKVAHEPTELQILRDGAAHTLYAPLAPLPPLLPRWHSFDASPEWVVIGGLVFSKLTAPLIEDAASESMPSYVHDVTSQWQAAKNGFNAEPSHEAVVLLDVLAGGDVNHGYEFTGWKLLHSFNGVPVTSLASLHWAWQHNASSSEFLEFGFGSSHGAERKIVLERAAVEQSEELLLGLHGVPSRASAGVLAQSEQILTQAAAHVASATARSPPAEVGVALRRWKAAAKVHAAHPETGQPAADSAVGQALDDALSHMHPTVDATPATSTTHRRARRARAA